MKKLKVFKNLHKELVKLPSMDNVNNDILYNAFMKIVKELEITKKISILDSLHLQPFNLEYIGRTNDGFVNYHNHNEQIDAKKDEYIKLVVRRDKKLESIKSFGKVSKIDKETLDMLLLLVRLSQYSYKNREMSALEGVMIGLMKNF